MILSKIGKIAATSNGQTYFDNPIRCNPIGARPSNRMALSSFMAVVHHAGSLQIWLESGMARFVLASFCLVLADAKFDCPTNRMRLVFST